MNYIALLRVSVAAFLALTTGQLFGEPPQQKRSAVVSVEAIVSERQAISSEFRAIVEQHRNSTREVRTAAVRAWQQANAGRFAQLKAKEEALPGGKETVMKAAQLEALRQRREQQPAAKSDEEAQQQFILARRELALSRELLEVETANLQGQARAEAVTAWRTANAAVSEKVQSLQAQTSQSAAARKVVP